jgi:hypothetical protein
MRRRLYLLAVPVALALPAVLPALAEASGKFW